ncbi:DUF4145 domain-containing protein [Azotobacter beijerinckii]|nr:DUF4145 domain-containing protein [Azotobacter beijerinckii]
MTFDLVAHTQVGYRHNWQSWYEAFCICRHCSRSTVFLLSEKGIDESKAIRQSGLNKLPVAANKLVTVENYVSLKDAKAISPPEYLPPEILSVFSEGATCLAVGCFNAAGTMFRLCVDLATKSLLPEADANGLSSKIRRNLGLRLPWLFEQGLLPNALQELSSCIKEDGNDGAHDGTLGKEDAEDLLDFTFALLERMYTEPERLRLAKERRESRRAT